MEKIKAYFDSMQDIYGNDPEIAAEDYDYFFKLIQKYGEDMYDAGYENGETDGLTSARSL